MKKIVLCLLAISIFIIKPFHSFASNNFSKSSIIKGVVKDKVTKDELPGASLMIKGTSVGTATDINGRFLFNSLEIGNYTFVVKYIGYIEKEFKVSIQKEDEVINLEIQMESTFIEGEEVVVSAQAEAQKAAINQQLSAQSIKNIVSAKKIQEVPDANAAEAIGRLPGVSLVRNGGEGNKVIIRGLSPKYNSVQVEGIKMSATGSDDRSTDLSMVSPYILEGIEVTKAALPDKEADVIGGSVNFLLKEASENLKFDMLVQSGYNGLVSQFGDYKFVSSGSNRFFDGSLGVFAQFDFENRNRSSYELDVNFTNRNSPLDPEEVDVSVGNLFLKDIDRGIKRYGGTLVLDYKLPNGKIKLSNFLSKIDNNNIKRIDNLRPILADQFYTIEDKNNSLSVMTNSLRIEQNISDIMIDGGISFSYSENKSPSDIIFQGYEPNAFDVSKLKIEASPQTIPSYLSNNLKDAYLYDISLERNYTSEKNLTSDLNIKTNFNLWDLLSVTLKAGAMIKSQNKNYDKEVRWMPIAWGGGLPANSIKMILEHYPWMQTTTPIGSSRIPYELFLDKSYAPNNFLGGNYSIKNMPQLDMVREISELLKSQLFYSYHRSIKDDYSGEEDYLAGYIMPEIKIGSILNLIPGIRYEYNQTKYNGVRGNDQTLLENIGYVHTDTTTIRREEFLLPMIHLKIKPVTWFDLRLAYTKTLSRPSYNQIIPSWNRSLNMVTWNNPNLKTSQSANFDAYASFYTNELGLLTIGGFYKEIKDLIYWAGIRAIIDPAIYGLPKTEAGKTITQMVNNKYTAYLSGIEIEWQTNFWYLPGLLKGIVLNTNYTHAYSSTKYPRSEIKTKYLTQAPWVITTNIDTFFVERLIDQPNDIFNFTIGYDYKDFSIRVSMLYQDDIFKRDNFYRRLRGTSDSYTRWDMSVKQKLPIEGLDVIGNFNNITGSIERDLNVGTNFSQREQHYGFTMDFGVRYRF